MRRILFFVLILVLTASTAWAERIVCASTTSTQNSGLFEYLLPLFKKKTGIDVSVVAVGTGAAIETGKRGDADVVLVHAKDLELKALREGYFVNRHDVMYNDFVIVGPPKDPAGVSRASTASEAMASIARAGAPFVSRGDNSGTNHKELFLWKTAKIDPAGRSWYLEVGQGMAKTLRIASEKDAYTLTDRGTLLSLKDKEKLALAILFQGDPTLFNQYGVMAVNPKRHKHVKYDAAMTFINWLISEDGQKAIGSFTDEHGNQLFHPNAK
ncbi:MAG: extracellular solute-binding protein [Nitrospirota bacterium]|jgi:tungstate transport system substrate-binding protein